MYKFIKTKAVSPLDETAVILKILSTEYSREGAIDEFNKFIHQKDKTKLRALTLTIRPHHWQILKKHHVDAHDMWKAMLDYKNIKGIFVIEYTKKNTPHIHGISTNTYNIDDIKSFWGNEAKNLIMDSPKNWIEYCTKDYLPHDIFSSLGIHKKNI